MFELSVIRKRQLLGCLFLAIGMTWSILSSSSQASAKLAAKPVCAATTRQLASCDAETLSSVDGKSLSSAHYSSGFGPADLVSAYKLPALPATNQKFSWNGRTVAIVDAYDNPNAAVDLIAYRRQFHLPLCSSSSTRPSVVQLTSCLFRKVNQLGNASSLPSSSSDWGQEIDLDIQMVSAACPSCKILLVEANSSSQTNLGLAVDRAATLRANAISNSYGMREFKSETTSGYAKHYDHPGIAITASAGDDGYGVEFPAVLPTVTAVGGTSLSKSFFGLGRGWSEAAWAGTGSGCSLYIAKPAWQSTVGSCAHRVVADVSAVADPDTGVAVYDSYRTGGWMVLGGTSAGAPFIAGLYGLAGNTGGKSSAIRYGEYLYNHKSNLFDVKNGSNGSCFSDLALCIASTGFDGPTGLGTPNGLVAF